MSNEPEPTPSDPKADPTPPVDPAAPPADPAPSADPEPSLLDPPKDPADPADPPADPVEPLTMADLSFSEGVEFSDELGTEFLGIVNNAELDSKGCAQALVTLQEKVMTQASEMNSQAWTEMQGTWQAEVKADSDIGGSNLQPTLDRIGNLVIENGSPELLEVLATTGAGNNIHVIRFLNTVATKLGEGGPVSGGPTEAPADAASKLFPSMKG